MVESALWEKLFNIGKGAVLLKKTVEQIDIGKGWLISEEMIYKGCQIGMLLNVPEDTRHMFTKQKKDDGETK